MEDLEAPGADIVGLESVTGSLPQCDVNGTDGQDRADALQALCSNPVTTDVLYARPTRLLIACSNLRGTGR